MTARQLSLKRSVYDCIKENIKDVFEFVSFLMNLMNLMKFSLRDFKNELCRSIMIAGSMDTETDFEITCIYMITIMVQSIKDNNDMKPYYTFFTKEVLPVMWKDRKGIELKRQLEHLAKLLDKNERYQEAHIIRIIVKPYLEEMNRKWTNMTAQEKFRSLFL